MTGIREEIRALDVSKKALRSFGYVVGGVLVGVAVFILWRRGWEPGTVVYVLGGIGGALMVLGLVLPVILRPIYRVWMGLAFVLGFIMTRVLLTLVFYLVVTPIGLLLRLFGKDPMQRALKPDQPSYWIPKPEQDDAPKRLEKYY